MALDLPKHARAVIVGGGVIGCSVAYHLTKMGWSDIVLLERKQLTSGTTWHAAGLVGQLRQSINMTQLARYTGELYRGLEAETGQATGYRQCGSLSLATTPGRMEELKRNASMAKVFGLPVNVVGPKEIHSPISRTSSAAFTYRAMAMPMPSISRRPWPKALAAAARRFSRTSKSPPYTTTDNARAACKRTADASMPTMSFFAVGCGPAILPPPSA
jgi:hypothetical protein